MLMPGLQTKFEVALKKWLAHQRTNTLVTVTLKQGLPPSLKSGPCWVRLTRDEAARTARIIRDRVGKRVSRKALRAGNWPFLVFIHEDTDRLHIHILTECPEGLEPTEFDDRFNEAIRSLDWVYDRINCLPIGSDHGTRANIVGYGLKGGIGLENFVPEASSLG